MTIAIKTMNYRFNTHAGMIHAHVTPTLQALGDQPWKVELRSVEGVLVLSCFVEDSSALGAAAEAVRYFLDCKKDVFNKSFSIS